MKVFTLIVSSLLITYTFGQGTGCAVGLYQVTAGTSCVACPDNNYCPASTTDALAVAALNKCPAGTQRTTGSGVAASVITDCTACTAGQYSATGTACTAAQCAINKYCPVNTAATPPATTLTNCPAGTDKATAGLAATTAACNACTNGLYAEPGAACTACPVGSYCTTGSGATAATKTACPTGTTTSGTGKTAASDCNVSSGAGVLVSSTLAVTVLGSIMLL